jgi:predicted phage-related endonuclease
MSVAIQPGSPEHMRLVTPSKVAAILGVSRFSSPYRTWHQMAGLIEPEPPKEIFALGHDFEPAMASIWKRQNPGWRLSRDEVQIVVSTERFGFPAAVTLDRRASRGRARRNVEFKTARDLSQWGDYFTDQAPADYVAQVQAQMLFSGYTDYPAHLMVLGPFFEAHTYVIEYDPEVADAIVARCKAFYDSLQSDTPPELDDSVPTYETVKQLHPEIDGSTANVDLELAASVLAASDSAKAADTELRYRKTLLLDAMGFAASAMCGDVKIADRRPHGKGGVALALATKNLNQLNNNEGESE